MRTSKEVAIKILKVKTQPNKRESLECLFREMQILACCRHPNIVKLLEASVSGELITESLVKPTCQRLVSKRRREE